MLVSLTFQKKINLPLKKLHWLQFQLQLNKVKKVIGYHGGHFIGKFYGYFLNRFIL